MYNPLTFIKDIIDILKDGGPGNAVGACPITPGNRARIIEDLGPRSEKYAQIGDFVVEFDNTVSIVPAKDFHKHYAFRNPDEIDDRDINPVITIKPL